MNIVTMKWGKRYGVNQLNNLFAMVQRHAPGSKVFCFTDDTDGVNPGVQCLPLLDIDLPEKFRWTFWRKITLFSPKFPLAGPCLYLDLDVAIVRPMAPLCGDWSGKPRFIKNWVGKKTLAKPRYDRINSSVMLLEPARCRTVWDTFHANQQKVLTDYPGDQGFVYDTLAADAEFFTEGLCVSYKRHCLRKFPLNLISTPQPPPRSIVVCFHGKPDPDEAGVGYWQGRWKHRSRPAPWAINGILHDENL